MPLNIQATYKQGDTIDVEVVLTAHHMGYFQFKACPLAQHGDVPTQACFDSYKLEFVEDVLHGVPKDDNYPERAYIPPTDYNFAELAYIPPASDSTVWEGNPPGWFYHYR